MSSSPPSLDLVVVGGGLIGLSVAREAARLGLRVTLFERGEPGGGASRAAAGMLSPLGEASSRGSYLQFGLASLRMYRGWIEEVEERSGVEVEFRECGKISVARSAEEEADLRERREWADAIGLRAETLSEAGVRELLPGISGEVAAGLLVHDDFRVSPRKLTRALLEAARRDGVVIRAETGIRSLRTESGRVAAVLPETGAPLSIERVLLAAGAWSGTIGGIPRLPIRPVRGQMAALHPDHFSLGRTIETEEVYLVPRDDGRILIGATVEEVGFQEGNTAGGIRGLLTAAARLFPELEESRLGEIWSGLRPATADGNPILGADPEVEGLFHASGHFRNGVLLAPVTAERLAPLLAGEGGKEIPPEFSPARFGTAGRERSLIRDPARSSNS